MCGSRKGAGGPDPPPSEKSQKYRVSQRYWSGSPEKHKAAKLASNVGPSSVRQRNTFKWRFAGGSMMAHLSWYLFGLDPFSPLKKKKKIKKKKNKNIVKVELL